MASFKKRLRKLFRVDMAKQGGITDMKLNPNINLEVIGIGLPRTGTTSLQEALTRLGFGPHHGGPELVRSNDRIDAFIGMYSKIISNGWKAGDPVVNNQLRGLMQGYRSCSDNPIFGIPEEVYAAYPDAKYILTVRPGGGEAWWKSMAVVQWHFANDWWRTWFRFAIYPVSFLKRIDDHVGLLCRIWRKKYGSIGPNVYDAHNSNVQKLMMSRQLLVYDVREGWEPLCKFLGVPVPDEAFPRLNDSKAMRAMYVGFIAFGLCYWAMYACVIGGLTYLAFYPGVLNALLERVTEWAS